ncbi:MAG: MFS transporter [Candidatus Muiribacterium halophilum]|uniref:MFS transporter n=1 Tax=Muiribacterium halophilum TaxID=2053465 RepID=A0A2N5ZLE9_MUIH1|nr:MAG: MFS transporter [Candidatus Muirbacterium halophilum]
MIKVKDLTRKYGDFVAVDNISFEVNEGEIVGFLGPNGAGKTTTLRVLTGFSPANSGNVEIAGYDIFENPIEVKKRIGYLPEFPPLYTDFSVKDYLSFVADIKGVESRKKKEYTEYAVEKCGLENVYKKTIMNLSKGYRQRVGIAQSLIHKPDILLLDEPTSGLDPIQIIEVRNLIKELRKEHTIMLSTHILPEVSATCSRVIIINNGKIIAKDTPENLSDKLTGAVMVKIKIANDIEKAKIAVSEMDVVKKIESNEDMLEVELKNKEDISKVIKNLVEAKADILSVVPSSASLEQVFHHLITREEIV